jgi:hypothetical protein
MLSFLFPLRGGAIGLEPKIEEVFFTKFLISDLKEYSILLYNTSNFVPLNAQEFRYPRGLK